jgi:hypothetical protein
MPSSFDEDRAGAIFTPFAEATDCKRDRTAVLVIVSN